MGFDPAITVVWHYIVALMGKGLNITYWFGCRETFLILALLFEAL